MGIAVAPLDAPVMADTYRVLIARSWPRGCSKQIALDLWSKELAPGTALQRWFAHDASRWETFRHRYAGELDGKRALWQKLLPQAERHRLCLLHAGVDDE